jgi:hypothetical protein
MRRTRLRTAVIGTPAFSNGNAIQKNLRKNRPIPFVLKEFFVGCFFLTTRPPRLACFLLSSKLIFNQTRIIGKNVPFFPLPRSYPWYLDVPEPLRRFVVSAGQNSSGSSKT